MWCCACKLRSTQKIAMNAWHATWTFINYFIWHCGNSHVHFGVIAIQYRDYGQWMFWDKLFHIILCREKQFCLQQLAGVFEQNKETFANKSKHNRNELFVTNTLGTYIHTYIHLYLDLLDNFFVTDLIAVTELFWR